MKNPDSKALSLFLLMINLNNLSSKEKILEFFLSAVKEIWSECDFSFITSQSMESDTLFAISNGNLILGYVQISPQNNLTAEDLDLLSNAIVMLSLVMMKIDKDMVIEKEKELLENLVAEQVKEIKASEEKFRNVFEHSIEGKSITTPDGRLNVNGAFCRMLGYSKEEMDQIVWPQVTFPEDTERDQKIVNSILAGERQSARWEKRYIRKEGSIILTDISTTLQRDKDGHPLYFITTVFDITELRQAGEKIRNLNETLEQRIKERTAQLEESNQELEAFSYSVSHDLRAPVRHINGYVGLMRQHCCQDLNDKGLQYLEAIAVSSDQMGRLIDELLQFSRSGKAELDLALIDINLVLEDALQVVMPDTTGRNIKWEISPLPRVNGDFDLLRLVWINLLSNAVKFTRTRKTAMIKIGFREDQSEYVFFIKDNGVGFDMKYGHKLFGVFQRLHAADQFEGTGIGLANVRRIILKHGGRVWAEAEIDKGTVFYFTLPKNNR